MKYERLTIKRENGFATVRNTTLQGLIDRLAELEDKIERGELDYVADSKTEQTITDLLIEFDEMGFVPTTLCPDIEKYAIEWREKVRAEIKRLENENAALRERLKKAIELPFYVFDKKTGKEADTYEIVLNEDWAKHLMYCDIDGFAIGQDGTLVLIDECGQIAYCSSDRFEICSEARLKEMKGDKE